MSRENFEYNTQIQIRFLVHVPLRLPKIAVLHSDNTSSTSGLPKLGLATQQGVAKSTPMSHKVLHLYKLNFF